MRLINRKQYRLTDVLWWTDQDKVMNEIAEIMKLNSVDTNTPGWFQYRTTAAKNILDNMSNAEMNRLRKTAEEMSEKGFPEELQRK